MAAGILAAGAGLTNSSRAQTTSNSANIRTHALGNLDDALLEWPLPPDEQRYAAIDGHRLHRVEFLATDEI